MGLLVTGSNPVNRFGGYSSAWFRAKVKKALT